MSRGRIDLAGGEADLVGGKADLARSGKEECREEHGIGGGDFFARDGLGAGFFASGAMIQPSE